MKFTKVNSSAASEYSYENGTLTVRYKNGKTYEYSNVSQQEMDTLLSASSFGNALNTLSKTKSFKQV